MSIRVAAQLGLFQYLDEKAPSSVTAAKLAEYCKAEELLIRRWIFLYPSWLRAAEEPHQFGSMYAYDSYCVLQEDSIVGT